MLFSQLETLPPDPILGMATAFRSDPSPDKVDVGIGVYNDESGHAPVLNCVKLAETQLQETQTTKSYFSPAGNPAYNAATQTLLFGKNSPILQSGRARTVQTPGGTAALRVAADFIYANNPEATVWVPTPTWANHHALFPAASLRVQKYPYYDAKCGLLEFEKMMDKLRSQLRENDIVLLHGCCHNPSGADLNEAQWIQVADLCQEKGATPLIDLAYQGFVESPEEDAQFLRLVTERVPEMLVASSYSKNFAIYRERVGALTLVSDGEASAERAYPHLLRTIRRIYSMPPDHGAAVVSLVLSDNDLHQQWLGEVAEMRKRIKSIRMLLADLLTEKSGRDYGYITRQNGMFSMLDVHAEDVSRMKSEFHIYMAGSGRINVAGLTPENIDYVTSALVQVLAEHQ